MLYNVVKSYFYPRSPCGERLFALLCNLLHHDFYPRSPCGERLFVVLSLRGDYVFLSTLSLRRATPLTSGTKTIFTNFYPRSPCGERRCLIMLGGFAVDFYPRSPCGERLGTLRTVSVKKTFLSTLSLRRATRAPPYNLIIQCISIHALLAESDRALATYWTRTAYFYPRSPCGERQRYFICFIGRLLFLSTLSLRRATPADVYYQANAVDHFYPRSPCGERHTTGNTKTSQARNFYPRSPCGERLPG